MSLASSNRNLKELDGGKQRVMVRQRVFLALVAFLPIAICFGQDRPYPLTVGDPAPPLVTSKFVKGTPVASFAKGQIYVVDMWATWCGPCRRSIPEITDLANKYKDKVQCIGVSIWERDLSGVEPFVQKMGDKMGYTVAEDVWPAGAKSGREGVMANTWMAASGMKNIGIPTAFVIDGDGKIAWIGHPDNLAKPLGEIVAGTYDRNAFALTYNADMVKLKAKTEIMATFNKAVTDKDWPTAEASADKLVALDPSNALTKFDLFLTNEKDRTKALAYGKDVSAGILKDDPDSQTQIAWDIAGYVSSDPKPEAWPDGLDLALQTAERAVEIDKRKDSTYLMVLARVHHVRGEKDLAMSVQKEAIAAASDPATKESLEKGLKDYSN